MIQNLSDQHSLSRGQLAFSSRDFVLSFITRGKQTKMTKLNVNTIKIVNSILRELSGELVLKWLDFFTFLRSLPFT